MGKAITIGLVVFLVLSMLGNLVLFIGLTNANTEISELEKQLIPGVRLSYDKTALIIENASFRDIDIRPWELIIFKEGDEIFTQKKEFTLKIAIFGGYYRDSEDKVKLTPGVHYKCINVRQGDYLHVHWIIDDEKAARNFKFRLFDEEGFKVYQQVMQNYKPGEPSSAAQLLDVEINYQLMGSTPENAKSGGIGYSVKKDGQLCMVFENWGNDDIIVKLGATLERKIKI